MADPTLNIRLMFAVIGTAIGDVLGFIQFLFLYKQIIQNKYKFFFGGP